MKRFLFILCYRPSDALDYGADKLMILSNKLFRINFTNWVARFDKIPYGKGMKRNSFPVLTQEKFLKFLSLRKGTVIVGLETLTDAKAKKNPFGIVLKRARGAAMVGARYEAGVNRQRDRVNAQGPVFRSEPLPWGEWMPDFEGKIIEYNGELYLRVQSTPGQRRKAPVKIIQYLNQNGDVLNPDSVKRFLPAPSFSFKQAISGLNPTEEQVWVRNIALKSIQKIRVDGNTYRLKT